MVLSQLQVNLWLSPHLSVTRFPCQHSVPGLGGSDLDDLSRPEEHLKEMLSPLSNGKNDSDLIFFIIYLARAGTAEASVWLWWR